MLLSSVSGAVALCNSAIYLFLCMTCSPIVRFLFRERRCGFEPPSGSGQKVEYVQCPSECPNICLI